MDNKSERKISEKPKSHALCKFGNFILGAGCGVCALLALDWAVLKNPMKAGGYVIVAVLCAVAGCVISKTRKTAVVTQEPEDDTPDQDVNATDAADEAEAEDEKVEAPLV